MKNVVGIVNLHDTPSLGALTAKRPLGVTTFLGRYGIMDFSLSNFSNSGIDRVIVLVENEVHSVKTHLGNGEVWVSNTKLGFQRILTNESVVSVSKFNTDIANLRANYHIINDVVADYYVIAPAFFVMSYDYNRMIQKHIASGADISVLCKHISGSDKDYLNVDGVDIDDEDTITHFFTNTGRRKELDISLESFIFSRSAFERMLKDTPDVSLLYTIRRMVSHYAEHNLLDVKAVMFNDYVVPLLSFSHYVRYSFDLLKYANRLLLFKDDWPVYTTTHNTPPALYSDDAEVCNSFVANGSIVKGKVKNSIISRDVIIEDGAVVEDSIIFTKSQIGKDVKIRYVVADKQTKIVEKKKISGEKDELLYISQGVRV